MKLERRNREKGGLCDIRHAFEWEEEMKGWWGLIGMTVICAELTDL